MPCDSALAGCDKKITKDSSLVQYRVGFLQGNVENWKVVECKIGSEFFATCSCAKFETFRILCKHILYIMRRKLLTIIPNHYILPRWTMKAIDLVRNIGTECRGADVNTEVSLLTLWSIQNKFTKILKDGKDFPLEIKRLDHFLNGILEEQNMRKKARVEFDTNDSSGMSETQVEESQPDAIKGK
ncbi:FAR1-related sequence 5-like protein [Tanacetum coccineum]